MHLEPIPATIPVDFMAGDSPLTLIDAQAGLDKERIRKLVVGRRGFFNKLGCAQKFLGGINVQPVYDGDKVVSA